MIALLHIVMKTDSSNARVIQYLRHVADGQPPGTRLPSVRALMAQLRVSPVTVQQALDSLAHEGVLDTRPGQGTFVANRRDAIETQSDMGWQSLALGPARAASAGLASTSAQRF
jgi:DNA-binding GntR family transcriptional regulator